ncbi:MAG: hypothetical protein UY70_C0002G0022 [Candidatus Kaiserbacteria bacterium GW2011_GWB1_52_6]|uniref:Uncharacterized protein n=3 Tax=Candidatus Kaiseribacteriota TaxID=1752734 RepID=A0A0G1XIG8_9BACT|nr:MAG: hypothetical protein UY67_C0002G0022 [Candidatus Kaiserbacteria bacterium GW2011_GWA2_52_12]KKW28148.1 MAG: hypothetical protein UY70_C0002G0022 [Candidatus Kaiserbacteria bacterium GW2011_GWB1_52_6]KKW30746.1 MAG: hypothetical protein UY74_C0033G0020 [Candidatus Kaiserbacteria bacterium GW2011_GWC2_52_8b]
MKSLFGLVGVVVVIVAIWYIGKQTSSPSAVASQPMQQQVQTQSTAQIGGGLSTTGSSDAELNQDLTEIDGQIQAAAQASATASQTDQPINQTE